MAKNNTLNALEKGGNVLDFYAEPYDFLDKTQTVTDIVQKAMSELSTAFVYKGAEDIETLDTTRGELYTQTKAAVVAEVKGDLYIFSANLAGEPSPYYMPTKAIITSPALEYSGERTIGKDCAVIWNDAMHRGVLRSLQKWATLMAEVELTMLNKLYNGRCDFIINAGNDKAYKAAMEYLEKQKRGDRAAIMADTLRESLKVAPMADKVGNYKELIEFEQYLWARMWQAFGLQVAGYNLKSQYVNEEETTMGFGIDLLAPPASDMLRQRGKGWDMANALFGTHIEPVLGSSWKIRNDKNNNGISDTIEGQEVEETQEEEKKEEENKEDGNKEA